MDFIGGKFIDRHCKRNALSNYADLLKSIGFSIVLIGILEGVAEATAGLSKGYFGKLSDISAKHVLFVRIGYAFSVISKPMMAVFCMEEKAEELESKGIKIALGDYDEPLSLIKTFSGVDKLLLVSATDLSNRLSQHANIIEAAKAANVKHILYTSGARTIENSDSLLWLFMHAHFETERLLKESGLKYTILRNSLYLDTIPLFIGDVKQSGVIYLPAGEGKWDGLYVRKWQKLLPRF
ncbi:NAD(P)H-binding protein [Pedobacter sp. ISL-68]|uniref:NAD(P)H-binding protein n=1 Tax=unclassified Pedobacter TaxID=2628915 RepID=UPI001BE7547C|nr:MULTISPECIES: NAD(P)H-binding protein [unclassified Pedobacter]MBT2560183.1 NAD(P)H-binding protein [Pedobacter sp. ISL-64]MBT2589162.1 NAD(P)H-binding protein [Pedobacter sp. ISL-68]